MWLFLFCFSARRECCWETRTIGSAQVDGPTRLGSWVIMVLCVCTYVWGFALLWPLQSHSALPCAEA